MEKQYLGDNEFFLSYKSDTKSITLQCNGRGRRDVKDYFISIFVGFNTGILKEILGVDINIGSTRDYS